MSGASKTQTSFCMSVSSSTTPEIRIDLSGTGMRRFHTTRTVAALAIFLKRGPEMPNDRLEFATHPTRKSDALLLAAQPER